MLKKEKNPFLIISKTDRKKFLSNDEIEEMIEKYDLLLVIADFQIP